jgi:hypothetical protein
MLPSQRTEPHDDGAPPPLGVLLAALLRDDGPLLLPSPSGPEDAAPLKHRRPWMELADEDGEEAQDETQCKYEFEDDASSGEDLSPRDTERAIQGVSEKVPGTPSMEMDPGLMPYVSSDSAIMSPQEPVPPDGIGQLGKVDTISNPGLVPNEAETDMRGFYVNGDMRDNFAPSTWTLADHHREFPSGPCHPQRAGDASTNSQKRNINEVDDDGVFWLIL